MNTHGVENILKDAKERALNLFRKKDELNDFETPVPELIISSDGLPVDRSLDPKDYFRKEKWRDPLKDALYSAEVGLGGNLYKR